MRCDWRLARREIAKGYLPKFEREVLGASLDEQNEEPGRASDRRLIRYDSSRAGAEYRRWGSLRSFSDHGRSVVHDEEH